MSHNKANMRKHQKKKIKLIYLMGMGRSGGTLLGRILGQLPSSIYVGELRYLMQRGIAENWECSCGNSFDDCSFWNHVCQTGLASAKKPDMTVDLAEQDRFNQTRRFPWLFIKKLLHGYVGSTDRDIGNYCRVAVPLYQAICSNSGANKVIESSRYPSRGVALSMCEEIDVYAIHLIRDPRGVINSQLKKDRYYSRKTSLIPVKRVFHWTMINLFSSLAKYALGKERYMVLRYEQFVDAPMETTRKILSFIGEQNDKLDFFVSERHVRLDAGHVFSANENRNSSGSIEITLDENWPKELPGWTRRFITAATLIPMLIYGYRSRRGHVQ